MPDFLDVIPHKLVLQPRGLKFGKLRILRRLVVADLKPFPAVVTLNHVHNDIRTGRRVFTPPAQSTCFPFCPDRIIYQRGSLGWRAWP
jgi:hypothetical protein